MRSPPTKKELSEDELRLMAEIYEANAREDFMSFRHVIRPTLLDAWWQHDAASHLQRFWRDLKAGKRPALVIQAPPQHGKTEGLIDFMAWCAGQDPNMRTIFASYSDDLGIRVNMSLQRIFDGPHYRKVFARTKISEDNVVTQTGRWLRNSSIFEYVGTTGSFRNTTVQGQINGQGLDLGVIDDPIKGRAEAQSKANRDKTWSWFTDDFFGRFSDKAGFVMIMTRWHLDDPVGRWLEYFPHTRVLRYPAVAEEDELHRRKGEALFPELKSREFLDARRRVLTNASWESLYQQRPIAAGGDMFPVERIRVVTGVDRSNIKRSVRYVDKAGTEDGGAYTAACLVHDMKDGTTVVDDVVRGQWGALEREARIAQVARADMATYARYQVWVEQEPGSGGKESAENTIRLLKGCDVHADKVTGAKEIRAEPYAAQVQAGQVSIKAADWNREFLEEHELYPMGKYKDQVDAAAGAFNKLAVQLGTYDRSLDWVG
jgi:predicted phage terminase large subunit-like protein